MAMNMGIYVTIGNGRAIGITRDNQLVIWDMVSEEVLIDLGRATTHNIKILAETFQRLETHGV